MAPSPGTSSSVCALSPLPHVTDTAAEAADGMMGCRLGDREGSTKLLAPIWSTTAQLHPGQRGQEGEYALQGREGNEGDRERGKERGGRL
eukprot:1368205-Rhodomonas_salina.4